MLFFDTSKSKADYYLFSLTRKFRRWEDCSVTRIKCLLCKAWGSELTFQNPSKNHWSCWWTLWCHYWEGKKKWSWDLLASQSSPLGEFQAIERHSLKKRWTVPEEWNPRLFQPPHALTYMFVCPYTQGCTHIYTNVGATKMWFLFLFFITNLGVPF